MKKWDEPKISDLALHHTLGNYIAPCQQVNLGENRNCSKKGEYCGGEHFSEVGPSGNTNGASGTCTGAYLEEEQPGGDIFDQSGY